jgi:hypothetical protein
VESTEYRARVVAQMVVHVTVSAVDDERTDAAARHVLAALRDFPEVESVARQSGGPAPDGARGGEVVALGGLIVTMLSQPEAVGAVMKFVADRVRRAGGSVEVEVDGQVLKIERATPEQVDVLVDAFVRKVFDQDS